LVPPTGPCAHRLRHGPFARKLPAGTDVFHSPFGGMNGAIDMTHGAVTQTFRHRVVFLTSHIGVHLAEQLQRLVKPTWAVLRSIDCRVITQVLAIINGS